MLIKDHLRHVTFLESKKDEKGRISFPVVIISEGMGNLVDRNYYTKQAIESGVVVYEGKKAYLDHPTETEMREQPGRSVKDIVGHFENCKVETDKEGRATLKADFFPVSSREDVIGLLQHAVEFKKKHPEKEFIGISINGDGAGMTMAWEKFIDEIKPIESEMAKLSQVEGQDINVIVEFTSAISADLVTEAGARGRVLSESNKNKKKGKKMLEAMKRLLFGIEKGSKEEIEMAVSEMEKGMEAETQDAQGALAKPSKEEKAGKLAAALKAAKEEIKKEEGETDGAYEAKCMAAAMEKCEAAEQEGEKKDEPAPEAPEKKEEPSEEKKEEAPAEHPDEKQDIALIKKLMGEVEELKKEMEGLKKGKEEAEAAAKEAEAKAAEAKIKQQESERKIKLDKMLQESGLPRRVTDEVRPLVERAKSDDEAVKIVERMKEAFQKTLEAEFMRFDRPVALEIQGTESVEKTDELFK